MQYLFNFFAPNLLPTAEVKRFKAGESFTLGHRLALVLDGVVAVDVTSETGETVTARLVGSGDILNPHVLLGAAKPITQYVCESPRATIAMVMTRVFRDTLESAEPEARLAVTQELLSQMNQQNDALIDTIIGVTAGKAKDKVMWAINRYRSIMGTEGCLSLRQNRIAAHLGIRFVARR